MDILPELRQDYKLMLAIITETMKVFDLKQFQNKIRIKNILLC